MEPRSYNFIIGIVAGFLVAIAFFTFCVCRMVRRRQRELNSNGVEIRAIAYENQRVLQSGEPLQRFHDSPLGTQNFGHHAVVVDTFADPSSTFSSDAPYAQVFDTTPSVPDCTPSAPVFESNSTSAPTTSYSLCD